MGHIWSQNHCARMALNHHPKPQSPQPHTDPLLYNVQVTQVDACLGIVLLVFQYIQLICAALTCLPNRARICFNPFETDWDKLN